MQAAARGTRNRGKGWLAWLQYSPMFSWNMAAGLRFNGETLFACSEDGGSEGRQAQSSLSIVAPDAATAIAHAQTTPSRQHPGMPYMSVCLAPTRMRR